MARAIDVQKREVTPGEGEGITFKMGPEEIARVWLVRHFNEPRHFTEADVTNLAEILQELWDGACEASLRTLRKQGRVRD